jgi:3-polyprenyl-4-hydroxybenzoate decarboxylase
MKREILYTATKQEADRLVDSYREHPFHTALRLPMTVNQAGSVVFPVLLTTYELD